MTTAQLDWLYATHLDGMVQAGDVYGTLRALAAMARETRRRSGAELRLPVDGTRLRIWSDLHFDDERIWWSVKRPFRSLCEMNQALRARWREAVGPGDTIVCVGDLGGRRDFLGRWQPPCVDLPGRKVIVLGNHDFTWFHRRERLLGADTSSMTLLIRSDPPLLVTHVPLVAVPAGCVNVHGHTYDFKPLEPGPWINVSVEQTDYRPLDVRSEVLPFARVLVSGRAPAGDKTIDRIRRVIPVD